MATPIAGRAPGEICVAEYFRGDRMSMKMREDTQEIVVQFECSSLNPTQ